MKQIAKIKTIDNSGRIQVCYDAPGSEKSRSSRNFWRVRERSFPAVNPDNLVIEAGDYVEIELPPGKTIASAFLVFILPLLSFFPGFILVKTIWPLAGELMQALGGLGGMAIGFAIPASIIGSRERRGKGTFPVITAVTSEKKALMAGGKKNCGSCTLCG